MFTKLIAHRGNTNGRKPHLENKPDYVTEALKRFDAEVDVWFHDKFFLGHDAPETEVDVEFLKHPGLWCHAKNIPALKEMLARGIHCFFHQTDDCVLTSRGFIWTYPGKTLVEGSVAVLPEWRHDDMSLCYGICSDFVGQWQDDTKKQPGSP